MGGAQGPWRGPKCSIIFCATCKMGGDPRTQQAPKCCKGDLNSRATLCVRCAADDPLARTTDAIS